MNILDKIFDQTKADLAIRKSQLPLLDIQRQAKDQEPSRDFLRALQSSHHHPSLIAEVKKASPSEGLIRPDFDPVAVANSYDHSGADCLSILTEPHHFQGSLDYLRLVRQSVPQPLLRKDFISDPYQIYEARAYGADAVLLITASLSLSQIVDLQGLIEEVGMVALVEVHSEQEAEVAVAARAKLIGINNRDLATFKTDLAVTEQIAPHLPAETTVVSESALSNPEDIARVSAAGARSVLIGTAFCRKPEIEPAVRQVMGW